MKPLFPVLQYLALQVTPQTLYLAFRMKNVNIEGLCDSPIDSLYIVAMPLVCLCAHIFVNKTDTARLSKQRS
jgi:hypothetical protein